MKLRVCKYCKTPGHNIATCCRLKQDVLDGQAYAIRVKEVHKAKRLAQGKLGYRLCSYCKIAGHNARNCQTKRKDDVFGGLRLEISANRKSFIELCKKTGFGVGSLLTFNVDGYSRSAKADAYGLTVIVTGLNADKLGTGGIYAHNAYEVVRIKSLSNGKNGTLGLPASMIYELDPRAHVTYESENIIVLKNPTRCHLPPEMWDDAWQEVTGDHAIGAKKYV